MEKINLADLIRGARGEKTRYEIAKKQDITQTEFKTIEETDSNPTLKKLLLLFKLLNIRLFVEYKGETFELNEPKGKKLTCIDVEIFTPGNK